MRFLVFNIVLILFVFNLHADDGYKRNFSADVIHYEFSIALNDSTDRIEANARIDVRFLVSTDSISFDFSNLNPEGKGMTVSDVLVNSEMRGWKHKGDKLTVYLARETIGSDTLHFSIAYNGIPADGLIISKNKYGSRTFFSDHWPDRAHNYLPCIDHPYDKASVDFIITTPAKYKVVASGIMKGKPNYSDNFTTYHWSEVIPLPTKVMAFGVADFSVQIAGNVNNIPVSSWVFRENEKEGFYDYSIAVKPLEYYSRVIGDYPFRKLANVQSRTIYGGLENAGNIFYSEKSVTGAGNAERLIAHEIAHQWFGDCVSESDWFHIWLSEGFATYLTSMYFESFEGKEKLKTDMISARDRVIRYSDQNKKAVIDTTIINYMDLLNPNSYQKGAWVLHMLRNEVGDEKFREGLSLFYKRYYNSNASTSDFQIIMEELSQKNLGLFFNQWLNIAGEPELLITRKQVRKGISEISVEQKQENLFIFNLELLIKNPTGDFIEKVAVNKRVTKIRVQSANISDIIPDPNVLLLFKY